MLKKIQKFDELILVKIRKLHSKPLNVIMKWITYLGTGGLVWFALCFPLLISKRLRETGVNIFFALLLTWLIGEIIIKHIVARIRPSEQLPESEQIVKRPKYYSFPSGHTASSFSVVGVTLLRCPAYIYIPVIVLACLIGFSRAYLRVHYFTDVVCGFALGLGIGLASVPLFNVIIDHIGVTF